MIAESVCVNFENEKNLLFINKNEKMCMVCVWEDD